MSYIVISRLNDDKDTPVFRLLKISITDYSMTSMSITQPPVQFMSLLL